MYEVGAHRAGWGKVQGGEASPLQPAGRPLRCLLSTPRCPPSESLPRVPAPCVDVQPFPLVDGGCVRQMRENWLVARLRTRELPRGLRLQFLLRWAWTLGGCSAGQTGSPRVPQGRWRPVCRAGSEESGGHGLLEVGVGGQK